MSTKRTKWRFFRQCGFCLFLIGLFGMGHFVPSSGRPIIGQIKSVWYIGWDKSAYASAQTYSELSTLKTRLQVNAVGLLVPLFQEGLRSNNPHRDTNRTPTDAQVRRVIDQAHALGLQVILLPYLISDDGRWVGELAPENTPQWFKRWRALLLPYAALAHDTGTEIFLIGWEFETLLPETEEWEKTISAVRENYGGFVSYITNFWANPEEYQRVLDWEPWELLDFIGLSAYFELARHENPSVEELRRAWHHDANGQDVIANLAELNEQYGRCLVLWELGYESKEGTTQFPWDFERPGVPDEGEQSRAFLGTFQSLGREAWFAGYSIWSQEMGLRKTEIGYDVLGKLAELTIRTNQLESRTCQDAR